MKAEHTDSEGRGCPIGMARGGMGVDFSLSVSGLEALLERACDGIFVRRADRLVYVNPALRALLGYEDDSELVGQSMLRFIHPAHHQRLIERIGSTSRGHGVEPPICVQCVRRDGTSVWLEGAGMPAKYHGELAYMVLVRDASARREEERALRVARETLGARLEVQSKELDRVRAIARLEADSRRRAEESLRRAQKLDAVGQLAGGIAHDFNNLLSVILAQSATVARQLGSDHPCRSGVEQVLSAAQCAADLTRRLLAVSRPRELQLRLVEVNEIVERMLSMLERVVGEHISIVRQLEPGLRSARLDPTQLEQVLLNLVVNARDAMFDGGTLTIRTANSELDGAQAEALGLRPGGYVQLVVGDTGCGMDRETLARIFEPFFTTKALGGGHGLGLSTAHGIVAECGGAIHVEAAVGQGAVFCVYLPSARLRPEPAAAEREPG